MGQLRHCVDGVEPCAKRRSPRGSGVAHDRALSRMILCLCWAGSCPGNCAAKKSVTAKSQSMSICTISGVKVCTVFGVYSTFLSEERSAVRRSSRDDFWLDSRRFATKRCMVAPPRDDIPEARRAYPEPWSTASRSPCLAALQRPAQCLFARAPGDRRQA
jgi:hypothetical protein